MSEFNYCKYCGSPLDKEALYCKNCGKKIIPSYPTKDASLIRKFIFALAILVIISSFSLGFLTITGLYYGLSYILDMANEGSIFYYIERVYSVFPGMKIIDFVVGILYFTIGFIGVVGLIRFYKHKALSKIELLFLGFGNILVDLIYLIAYNLYMITQYESPLLDYSPFEFLVSKTIPILLIVLVLTCFKKYSFDYQK